MLNYQPSETPYTCNWREYHSSTTTVDDQSTITMPCSSAHTIYSSTQDCSRDLSINRRFHCHWQRFHSTPFTTSVPPTLCYFCLISQFSESFGQSMDGNELDMSKGCKRIGYRRISPILYLFLNFLSDSDSNTDRLRYKYKSRLLRL